MSGLAAMSTLFENQFIPIRTVPSSNDFLLKMVNNCPNHEKLLHQEFKSEKSLNLIKEYLPFFNILQQGTG